MHTYVTTPKSKQVNKQITRLLRIFEEEMHADFYFSDFEQSGYGMEDHSGAGKSINV